MMKYQMPPLQTKNRSRKIDFLPVLENTPSILSYDGVFRLFQRKNKKRNFDGTERSVQNSVYITTQNDEFFKSLQMGCFSNLEKFSKRIKNFFKLKKF